MNLTTTVALLAVLSLLSTGGLAAAGSPDDRTRADDGVDAREPQPVRPGDSWGDVGQKGRPELRPTDRPDDGDDPKVRPCTGPDHCRRLSQAIATHWEHQRSLKASAERLAAGIEALATELRSLKEQQHEVKEALRTHQATAASLKDELGRAEAKVLVLKKELATVMDDLRAAQASLKEVQQQIAADKRQLGSGELTEEEEREIMAELEQLKDKEQRLLRTVADLEATEARLQGSLRDLGAAIERINAALRTEGAAVKRIEAVLSDLQRHAEGMAKRLSSLADARVRLGSALEHNGQVLRHLMALQERLCGRHDGADRPLADRGDRGDDARPGRDGAVPTAEGDRPDEVIKERRCGDIDKGAKRPDDQAKDQRCRDKDGDKGDDADRPDGMAKHRRCGLEDKDGDRPKDGSGDDPRPIEEKRPDEGADGSGDK